ncbi:MAG: cheY [Gemmatimonadetes bacterium]|nr:cheY [Gemmatimonadota bacterium]
MHERPTVALADDDVVLAELVSAWLEHAGYDVLRFESGDALLDWAAEAPSSVDAFLLDVDMPGRNGLESIRALRGIPIYSGTPTVFVSAHAPDDVVEQVSAAGSSLLRKDAHLLPRLTEWLGAALAPV